jgi:ferrous iron transport protein A
MFQIRKQHRISATTDLARHLTLTGMRNGQTGKVIQVAGGFNVTERLAALGIRPGQNITRIGGMFLRGPVTVKVEKTQVAIGFGMARKITIEPEP